MQQQQKYIRMAHIVSRLKTGENMGLPELQKSLQALEKTENMRLECGIATIQRDISELKRMGCPIVYHRSSARQSYELQDKTWELHSAPLMGADEMMTVVLGAQFGTVLLPKAEAARIGAVSGAIFKANTENFLKSVDMTSMKILMPPLSKDAEAVFSVLYDAWKQRRMVSVKYCDEKGEVTERVLEPQALVFHDMSWYVKAYCHLRNDGRTFAVTRIQSIAILDRTFENRPEFYRSLDFDSFDQRKPYEDIVIRLNAAGRQYAITHILHSCQKIVPEANGSFTMTVPAKAKHLAVEWILSQRGNATPVAPQELKDDVREACQKIMGTINN